MNIYVTRIFSEGWIHWVLYEGGKFDQPIRILTDAEMRSLVHAYNEAQENRA